MREAVQRIASAGTPIFKSFERSLTKLSFELRTVYYITKGLVWGIVAILVAVLALLVFTIVVPVWLRGLLAASSSQNETVMVLVALSQERGLVGLASLMFVFVIVVIFIGIIASIVIGVFGTKPLSQVKGADEASETLKLRYAKGEITKAQFLEMKKTLEQGE